MSNQLEGLLIMLTICTLSLIIDWWYENKKHDFYKWDKDEPPLEIPVYDDHPTPNGAGWFYLKVKEFPVPFWLWGDDENHIKTLCKQKGYAHLEWMKRDFPPFL